MDSSPNSPDQQAENYLRLLAPHDRWLATCGYSLVPDRAIPRGGSGDPLTIRGDALAEFVRQDTNGLVSFVILRETGESDHSGLVHAFASKEHPQLVRRRIAFPVPK